MTIREELEKAYYKLVDEYTNTYTIENAYVDFKAFRDLCICFGFEKAREHPNDRDKVLIEKYVHEGDGNSAGTYWIVKKINYVYESADELLKELDV